ncbi:MAG: hypothetical protein Q4F84_01350 [Fibrobacter sp.]|nr:hypothetical protein [Fibrobacter sp.]
MFGAKRKTNPDCRFTCRDVALQRLYTIIAWLRATAPAYALGAKKAGNACLAKISQIKKNNLN